MPQIGCWQAYETDHRSIITSVWFWLSWWAYTAEIEVSKNDDKASHVALLRCLTESRITITKLWLQLVRSMTSSYSKYYKPTTCYCVCDRIIEATDRHIAWCITIYPWKNTRPSANVTHLFPSKLLCGFVIDRQPTTFGSATHPETYAYLLRWSGHVCRMEDGCLPKDILHGQLYLLLRNLSVATKKGFEQWCSQPKNLRGAKCLILGE